MIDLDYLYYEWLLTRLDPDGVNEGLAYLCALLHRCTFSRRVGNDINRAVDGANLRKDFLVQMEEVDFDPRLETALLDMECTWLEMLIALSVSLDYLYDGGIEARFIELVTNLELDSILQLGGPSRSEMMEEYDQHLVDKVTSKVDRNRFNRNGRGGIFPLQNKDHPDQREVEIWDQHAAYFRERLEGVLWTSTR